MKRFTKLALIGLLTVSSLNAKEILFDFFNSLNDTDNKPVNME